MKRLLKLYVTDTADRLTGKRDGTIPPVRHMYDGTPSIEDFKANGQEFLRHFVELADLKPHERVLDVGSGMGRKTLPLTTYLNSQGGYEGFDIAKLGVRWTRRKIGRKYPNFNFTHADIHNPAYNKRGRIKASEFRFPYPDASFDFVVLGSVFTHMLPADVNHYLNEIGRVLKPGGRAMISYFLINPESRKLMKQPDSTFNYRKKDGYYTAHEHTDEGAIAYDEAKILRWYDEAGMKLYKPIQYGAWCGRKQHLSFQDLIISIKQ